jgi:molybdenum cofactor guanylyltransferase
MGVAKSDLDWHKSSMLHRICSVIGRSVDGPVIVVSAPGQELPRLPAGVLVIEDPREGRGPMQGLAAGLAAAGEHAEAAYVSATDMPLLHPAFVRRVTEEMDGGAEIVLPEVRGIDQPLAAVYATSVAEAAQMLVDYDRVRFKFLFSRCTVRRLDDAELLLDEELQAADPKLESTLSVDDMETYAQVRSRPAPQVTIERVGALIREVDQGERPVRAATLAAAAAAAGLEVCPEIVVAIDGRPVMADPELALVLGDRVTFALAAAPAPAGPAAQTA